MAVHRCDYGQAAIQFHLPAKGPLADLLPIREWTDMSRAVASQASKYRAPALSRSDGLTTHKSTSESPF